MTLLSTVLLMPGAQALSLTDFLYNLGWVTLGNFIGGAFLVGFPYWYISKKSV
jgi:nitrite transporter NirC